MSHLLELKKPMIQIPRKSIHDQVALFYLQNNIPVILKDTNLVNELVVKWTPEYFRKVIPKDKEMWVRSGSDWKMRYYNPEQNDGNFMYNPTNQLQKMKFHDFLDQLNKTESDQYLYLQEELDDDMNIREIINDYAKLNWDLVTKIQKSYDWGKNLTNMLFISQKGLVTPFHYDEMPNLFTQIYGRKRFILAKPDEWMNFYCYPHGHPSNRQSQVDEYNPDLNRFQDFEKIQGFEAIIEPGEVLFIPPFYFHHVENPYSPTISMSWWYQMDDVTNYLKRDNISLATKYIINIRSFEKLVFGLLKEEASDVFRAIDLKESTNELIKNKIIKLLEIFFKVDDPILILEQICYNRYRYC